MIIAMAGLPGTGKSTLSRALADPCRGVVLDKDAIRGVLFPPAYLEYSREQDDFCQVVMLRTVEYLLKHHPRLRVFLDGRPFSRKYQIDDVIETADRLKTPWCVIECVCSEETAKRRLAEQDSKVSHFARNRSYELYRSIQARFEPILVPKLIISSDDPLDRCIAAAKMYVESSDGWPQGDISCSHRP
jgi:adenylylsulfate kinase